MMAESKESQLVENELGNDEVNLDYLSHGSVSTTSDKSEVVEVVVDPSPPKTGRNRCPRFPPNKTSASQKTKLPQTSGGRDAERRSRVLEGNRAQGRAGVYVRRDSNRKHGSESERKKQGQERYRETGSRSSGSRVNRINHSQREERSLNGRIADKLISVGYGFVEYLRSQCLDPKTGTSFFRVGTPGIDSIFDPLLNSNDVLKRFRESMRGPPLEVSVIFMFCLYYTKIHHIYTSI